MTIAIYVLYMPAKAFQPELKTKNIFTGYPFMDIWTGHFKLDYNSRLITDQQIVILLFYWPGKALATENKAHWFCHTHTHTHTHKGTHTNLSECNSLLKTST